MMDEAGIAAGAELYKMGPNCAVCHKADGGGQVGPNLTDNHSIYGNSLSEIFKSIKYGRANGMTSWKDKFTATQIGQIASYVKSLENTNVEGGKEPQGEIFELEEAVGSKTDSTALDL